MILKLAIRNIFRHRARSLITISTIVFGCVAIIFIGGFFEDVFLQLREGFIEAHTGHIQVYKEGFTQKGRVEPFNYLIDNSQEMISLIRQLPEVDYVTPRIQFSGLLSTGDNTVSFVGQGVDPQYEKSLSKDVGEDLRKAYKEGVKEGVTTLKIGQGLDSHDEYGVILGEGLAASIDAKVNSSVTLLTNTVDGSTNAIDTKVKGVFYTSSKSFDDIFLRMPLKTAQKLLNTESVQSLVIKLHHTDDTQEVRNTLKFLFKKRHFNFEIKTWDELAEFYTQTVGLFKKFYLIMRIIVCVVIVLSIFNTMNMSVMERISEIGTIMALGTRSKGVVLLFLYEGIGLGAIGGAMGVVLGCVVVQTISCVGIIMPPPPGANVGWLSHPMIVPRILLSTFVFSIFIGGISAFYPAYRASRLVITDALRYR
ncbi:MAG: ABC transporter permease [Candidatus Omnitrophica bacterium]|nr:ABC transporter permease [Candidatus Omnitrophota bacterium]